MHSHSLFCSISLIFSWGILSLSTWSRSTLAHFCSDSIIVQGRDISATNRARQSGSDWAETANLSRPLWYTSPSRIHTLQRVRSAKGNAIMYEQHNYSDKMLSIGKSTSADICNRWTYHLCPHHGHLCTGTPVPALSCCVLLLEVWPWVLFSPIHPHL